MKQLISLLDSMKTMAILMSIFAFAIGYATFIENDYGTITSKADVFNTRWFEVLLAFLTINLALNIYKYKMFSPSKAPIFIFHIGFIVIIFGAAVTRYAGYEGSMHIREGSSASTMTSSDTYFTVNAKVGSMNVEDSQKVFLSKRLENTLGTSLEIDGKNVSVELIQYIPDAIEKMLPDEVKGEPVANMMVTGGGKGKPVTLKQGEYYETDSAVLNFGANKTFDKPVIDIFAKDDALFMKYDMTVKYLKMDDRSEGDLAANDAEPLAKRTLFTAGETSFVLREFIPKASM